jgi:uncharacterized repeat protein (TIGR02059 family)
LCLSLYGTTYYVSPEGRDSDPGTQNQPFFTLNKAWSVVGAGDIIYMRGGTYYYTSQQNLTGKNGTSGNLIKVWAYPGETPIITRTSSWTFSTYRAGIYFSGNYVHFKGFQISGYYQQDLSVWMPLRCQDFNDCIFELLNIHDNGGPVYMTGSCNRNLLLNCDFHDQFDPLTSGVYGPAYNNADGLNFEYVTSGNTNTIKGCRFWNNSDDGLDLYNNHGVVNVEDSWAWNNGVDENLNEVSTGDGNGFKFGPTNSARTTILRTVKNCLSFNNTHWGFFENNAQCNIALYNNVAFQNGYTNTAWCTGFHFDQSGIAYFLKNNIAYQNSREEVGLGILTNVEYNSWNSGVSVSDDDFLSLDSTGVSGERGPNGELPDLNFLKLVSGSDLVDAGVDVGISYSGNAPDIGAFEFQSSDPPPVPKYLSSVVENSTPSILEMTYDINLNSSVIPATSAFSVGVNSTARSIISVAISGARVRLTLSNPIVYGNVITVSYNKPIDNPIQTGAGEQAESVSAMTVVNKVNAIYPVYISSVIENATPSILEMSFDLTLTNIVPVKSSFMVLVNSTIRTINTVTISGRKVQLTLASAVKEGDIITVSYTKPAANPLQTTAGGEAANITTATVTNNIKNVKVPNDAPIVVVNSPKSAYAGFINEIDATSTYDPDNDFLSIIWNVPPIVPVSTVNNLRTKFLAPVFDYPVDVKFQLKVSDGDTLLSKDIPVSVLPYKPELTSVRITNIRASDFQSPDYPANIIDGNTLTKWSSKGDNKWIRLKFALPFKISHIEVAFLNGQQFESYFDIHVSRDSITWEPVLTNIISCNFSGEKQIFDFPAEKNNTEYLFLKYVGYGNSLNEWNNISEFRVFGTPGQNSGSGITENRKVIVYPNPVSSILNISIEDPSIKPDMLRIVDLTGHIVFEKILNPVVRNVQLPIRLKTGVYFVDLNLGISTLFTQKLLVKN